MSKTHPRLEAYGTVDELSSHLGLLSSLLTDHHHRQTILTIQQTLFSLSALLATEPESKWQPEPLSPSHTEKLEAEIDHLQQQLPALHSFIIPGGSQAACQAHVCRTVCRRTERRFVAVGQRTAALEASMKYLNRLSDYLFLIARMLEEGVDMRNDNIGRV